MYWISYYSTLNRDKGYNLKTGGQNGGSCLSQYAKDKQSASLKKFYEDPNHKKFQSEKALRKWANPEIKAKIIGENNGMYGKHHSEESKSKMSKAAKGRINHRRNKTSVFCMELNRIFDDATTAAKELLIDSSGILKVCRGERKTCGGYHW